MVLYAGEVWEKGVFGIGMGEELVQLSRPVIGCARGVDSCGSILLVWLVTFI